MICWSRYIVSSRYAILRGEYEWLSSIIVSKSVRKNKRIAALANDKGRR